MGFRIARRGGLLVLLTAALALTGFTALALASTGHRYSGQFSSPGGALGELSFPSSLALRQSSGDVYVLDAGNPRVQRFDAAGNVLSSFDGSATPAGTFAAPFGIAIDQGSGNVYVADTGNNVVDVFDKTGAFVTSFDGSAAGDGPFVGPTGVAVDGGHRVYVLDPGKNRVEQYTAQGGAFTSIFDSNNPAAVAADPSSSDIYVAENGASGVQVSELTSADAAISTFGPPHIAGTSGIGVNATTGTLYVADQFSAVVERFNAFIAATVTTEGASAVNGTEATLAGTINPEGVTGKTTYRFDYGLDTNYGASSAETDTGGGSSDVAASATITGLTPVTTYHYRLIGTNPSGTSTGADQTFTTTAAQAAVDVQAPFASSITTTGATLNDTLNPNGADTTYRYEYGTTTGYGSTTPDGDAGSVVGETPVAVPVSGLQPGTTYHFRVVAENGVGGPAQGADAVFTTAPATPPNETSITSSSATLNATVIPGATGSSYNFEYGTTTAYGTSTLTKSLSAGAEEVPVSVSALSLEPGTTYHFRVVALTNGQTVTGDDATFTTIAAAAVTTTPVTEVTTTSARLNATIDTHGVAGTVSFSVTSPEGTYAAGTTSASLAATSGPQSVSASLAGLLPGVSYVVRTSATVAGTTSWSEPVPFATPQLPSVILAPPPSISSDPYAGLVSSTVGPVTLEPPSNRFTIVNASVKGSTATLTVRVTGPGKLQAAGPKSTSAGRTLSRATTVQLTVHLSTAARKALDRSHKKKLTITLRVTFTPTAGTAATQTRTLTFKRGGSR